MVWTCFTSTFSHPLFTFYCIIHIYVRLRGAYYSLNFLFSSPFAGVFSSSLRRSTIINYCHPLCRGKWKEKERFRLRTEVNKTPTRTGPLNAITKKFFLPGASSPGQRIHGSFCRWPTKKGPFRVLKGALVFLVFRYMNFRDVHAKCARYSWVLKNEMCTVFCACWRMRRARRESV